MNPGGTASGSLMHGLRRAAAVPVTLVLTWIVAAALTLSSPIASALDFRSVGTDAAVGYDSPSTKGRKLSILQHGYPVEVLVVLEGWVKVRDATGELAWVEAKNLSPVRMLMIKVPRAEVRQSPDEKAPLAYEAEQDVVLELLDMAGNFAKVRHADGAIGYVRVTQVWGL
jgi:SH3-like domain-containing protein